MLLSIPSHRPAVGTRQATIIVPTLNEVANIEPLLAGIFAISSPALALEVIFVDDGSRDGTPEKIAALAETYPIRLIAREAATDGLSGAVVAGARAATTEWIVVMDADLSHPPAQILALLRPLFAGDCDLVIGSRYTEGGTTPHWPAYRRLLSRGAAALAWPLTDVRDSLSGFFAVRRAAIVELGGGVSGFKIGLEIIVRGGRDLRVLEVPIAFTDRVRGESKVSGRVVSTYLRQIAGFSVARIRGMSALGTAVLALWCLVLAIICLRAAMTPQRNTVFATYEMAGRHWAAGGSIYTRTGGFVYSPPVAAFFAPFSVLSDALANALWRALNVSFFTLPIWWWLRRRMQPRIPHARYWIVFLLLLPLSLGNFNNGQVNPLDIGLLMIAFIAADSARWWLAAACIAVATYLKLYPLVAGLLLCVMYPGKFAWRWLAALIALGLAAFLLQRPGYVCEQYAAWWTTRLADNRHAYTLQQAPRDLWRLLHAIHLPIGAHGYQLLQAASGALLASYAVLAMRSAHVVVPGRQIASARVLVNVFNLVCCWMLLLGPASESATYVLLAPAVVLAVVECLDEDAAGGWQRAVIFAALALLFVALAMNSFTHANRNPTVMILQPLAALLFTVASIARAARHRSPHGERPPFARAISQRLGAAPGLDS